MKAFEILRDSDSNYGKFEFFFENDSFKMRAELNKMTEAFQAEDPVEEKYIGEILRFG